MDLVAQTASQFTHLDDIILQETTQLGLYCAVGIQYLFGLSSKILLGQLLFGQIIVQAATN